MPLGSAYRQDGWVLRFSTAAGSSNCSSSSRGSRFATGKPEPGRWAPSSSRSGRSSCHNPNSFPGTECCRSCRGSTHWWASCNTDSFPRSPYRGSCFRSRTSCPLPSRSGRSGSGRKHTSRSAWYSRERRYQPGPHCKGLGRRRRAGVAFSEDSPPFGRKVAYPGSELLLFTLTCLQMQTPPRPAPAARASPTYRTMQNTTWSYVHLIYDAPAGTLTVKPLSLPSEDSAFCVASVPGKPRSATGASQTGHPGRGHSDASLPLRRIVRTARRSRYWCRDREAEEGR